MNEKSRAKPARRLAAVVAALGLASTLAACAASGELARPALDEVETVYVMRAPDEASPAAGPQAGLGYGAVAVAVPADLASDHPPDIAAPGRDSDYRLLREVDFPSRRQFLDAIGDAPPGHHEVLLYIHGYNTTLEASVRRLARIAHNLDVDVTPVVFTWPAMHSLLAYRHDREAAAASVDELAAALETLALGGATRIQIVAHSMGADLLMQALRRLKAANSVVLRRLDGVALVSPDIDPEGFLDAARALGSLPQPFTIYTCPDQCIFRLAGALLDERPRLGGRVDPQLLSHLSLTLVDPTEVSPPGVVATHFPLASSGPLTAAIKAMAEPDIAGFGPYAAAGHVASSVVTRFGRMTLVRLLPNR